MPRPGRRSRPTIGQTSQPKCPMRAGPKAAVDGSPLPFRPRSVGAARFAAFCTKFIVTPKGTGARAPMRLRPWQVELAGSVLDADPRPRTGRMDDAERSGEVDACRRARSVRPDARRGRRVRRRRRHRRASGRDRVQDRRPHGRAERRPVGRVQVFKDRLYVPERGASFVCLPAEPKRLEGLDPRSRSSTRSA